MAFLRSVTRCNSFVSKKLRLRSSTEFSAKFSRSELLASHRFYNELKRELNTRFNSSIATATSGHKSQQKNVQTGKGGSPKDPLDLTFNNQNAAFKSKTTGELVRAYVVYLLFSSTYLVDNNLKLGNDLGPRHSDNPPELVVAKDQIEAIIRGCLGKSDLDESD